MIKLKYIRLGKYDPMIPPILHYWTGKRWRAVPDETVSTEDYIESKYLDILGNTYTYEEK